MPIRRKLPSPYFPKANVMLTKLEAFKLEHYRKNFGHMSSANALQLALEAEQTARDCGPFDPAFTYFIDQQHRLEAYSQLLEKEELSPKGEQ